MIKKFVKLWDAKKDEVRALFAAKHPDGYKEVVKNVISILHDKNLYFPDPTRVHEINDGDYQGMLLYLIADSSYQPRDYWYVMIDYGSCSACDTLERIRDYDDGVPTEKQISEYMILALHILQGLKKLVNSDATQP